MRLPSLAVAVQTGGVLPSGFELPPLAHLGVVAVATVLVVAALYRLRPAVTDETVVALAPWMVAGAGLYALFQAGAVTGPLAPLSSSPTVYATTFVLAGTTWALAAWQAPSTPFVTAVVLLVGIGWMSTVLGLAIAWALSAGVALTPLWPAVGLGAAVVFSAVAWWAFRAVAIDAAATVGIAGPVVVFGHVLDGLSTALGLYQLGFAEQTPLSAIVLDLGESLFVAPIVGGGWLFVAVKTALALAVLGLLAGYVRDAPGEGYLTMAAVAAVGLGPGAHNVVLFTIASPALG